MADVLLSPIYGEPRSFDYLIPHAGVAMLAAALDEAGHTAKIYDPNLPRESLKGLLQAVKKYQPDIVGLSIYHNGFIDAAELAKGIREVAPKTKIVAGGPQVTTWEERVHDITDAFDTLGVGEGERTIQHLAEWADGKAELDGIPGIIYSDRGRTRKNPRRYLDLSELQEPAWQKFDLERYLPILTLEIGRGCPWSKCAFCVHGHISGARRERPIEAVLDEMGNDIEKYGVVNFRITDSSPTASALEQLANGITDRGYDARWCTLVRANQINPALAQKMAAAGCISAFIGVESGSDRMLELMNKGERVSDAKGAIRALKAAGIKVAASNIIGFPGETDDSIKRTVSLMNSLKPDAVMYYPLGILPSTPLAAEPERHGIKLHNGWEKKMLSAKIKLIGGRPEPLQYFDYADGKPNTYYHERVGRVIRRNALRMLLNRQSIQMPEHAYLLSEMIPEGFVDRLVDSLRLLGTHEMRLVGKLQSAMEKADWPVIEAVVSAAWADSRRRAGRAIFSSYSEKL